MSNRRVGSNPVSRTSSVPKKDRPLYARVVELADSLDSGSSVHYGRAGSSPASRTTSPPKTVSSVGPFWGGGKNCILYARVVELADSLDSGSSVHYGRAGSSPASRTTSPPKTVSSVGPFWGGGKNCILYARVVELADSLDSGSSVHYGRAGSSPASRTIVGAKFTLLRFFLNLILDFIKYSRYT